MRPCRRRGRRTRSSCAARGARASPSKRQRACSPTSCRPSRTARKSSSQTPRLRHQLKPWSRPTSPTRCRAPHAQWRAGGPSGESNRRAQRSLFGASSARALQAHQTISRLPWRKT
eukprot:Amastigsp_a174368_506.p4 type:complete len:116 gc:universal Amastigsp_a174368_506:601-948(+)